ncbi:MAG: ABC transporter ATP-binding protein [Erysipelotrichaceae bacterium]|nr:ABC transporter ATP-binding protein [Erysipelotrichaceae bacterium]
MSAVEVRKLVKKYPSFDLKEVSFSIEGSRITGFIGRNGAGKTTTIKAMLNMIHIESGEVICFKKPFAGNEESLKKRIGYSTGTVSWYPRKRICEIVETVKSFYDNWDEAAYRRYLQLFDLDETKKVMELSEGMKVKFNLLMALSHKAELLILDEPTSGLDPFSRNELLEIFSDLKKEGTAVFFSTHIISDIEKCADDIVYIRKGSIVFAGEKEKFIECFSKKGESLEDTMLRLEGGIHDPQTAA